MVNYYRKSIRNCGPILHVFSYGKLVQEVHEELWSNFTWISLLKLWQQAEYKEKNCVSIFWNCCTGNLHFPIENINTTTLNFVEIVPLGSIWSKRCVTYFVELLREQYTKFCGNCASMQYCGPINVTKRNCGPILHAFPYGKLAQEVHKDLWSNFTCISLWWISTGIP